MNVILATGGTGGHLFPALALGQAFVEQGNRVLFVGSGRSLDLQVEKSSGLRWKHLKVGRIKNAGWRGKLKTLFTLPYACIQSLGIIFSEKPDLVLGVGGYSTGPLVLMARFLAIKAVLLEPNSIPGMTNRLLSHLVNRIFIALPIVKYFRHLKRKIRFTGTPIRHNIIEQFENSPRGNGRFHLLVIGGSQGAHFLNELMIATLPQLQDTATAIQITHITGTMDLEAVQEAYSRDNAIEATVLAFSDEMGRHYKEADLVLSRAGAATIADLIQFGRPGFLVPYPFAADRHQEANAAYLCQAGAATMKHQEELNATGFAASLKEWIRDRSSLEQMASRAQALTPEAPIKRIIQECQELVYPGTGSGTDEESVVING